jgi:hypothetical protein
VSFTTVDEHDVLDGDMIARCVVIIIYYFILICLFSVLQLMQLTDTHVANTRNASVTATISNSIVPTADEHLEYAYLWHLEQYRKIYISDQVQRTSRVCCCIVILHYYFFRSTPAWVNYAA